MTEEQLTKGRELQDKISAAKSNIEQLTVPYSFVSFGIDFCITDTRNHTGRVRLGTYGDEPEITETIKQCLLVYYTERVAQLEKEFTNL